MLVQKIGEIKRDFIANQAVYAIEADRNLILYSRFRYLVFEFFLITIGLHILSVGVLDFISYFY